MSKRKIYWNLKSIPELKDLPTRQRWKAWFVCVNKAHKHWRVRLAFLFTAVVPQSLLFLMLIVYEQLLVGLILFCVLMIPAIMIFSQIQCEAIRPYLKKYTEEIEETGEGE